jgi:hypothetical protein
MYSNRSLVKKNELVAGYIAYNRWPDSQSGHPDSHNRRVWKNESQEKEWYKNEPSLKNLSSG